MADMIVDGAKLDACLDAEADAIRAKTGDSADIPFDYANNKGFADAIAAIPTGGGMEWELIVDYTSDANADVVAVTIPEGKQNYNIYRVHVKSNVSQYYLKPGINNSYDGYTNNAVWNCDGYICLSCSNAQSEMNGSASPTSYCFNIAGNTKRGTAPLTSVGFSRYDGSNGPVKAGLNIKIWRLVES